jgi:hypothetical protein
MSDIPAHLAIARTLFPGRADDFLFAMGDTRSLARLIADELESGRRATYLRDRLAEVRELVESHLSPRRTAEVLVALAARADQRSPSPPAQASADAEGVTRGEVGNTT